MSVKLSGDNSGDLYDIHSTIYLYLYNKIHTGFPIEIYQFINLRELTFSENKLKILPTDISKLVNLIDLDLSCNELINIPAEISKLVRLKELDLSYNNLTSLPDTIVTLPQLRTLNLSNNNLTSLPESIGTLINLENLILSHNDLTSLPNSIGNLTNIKHLFLTNNKLKSIPREILKIKICITIDDTSYEIDNLDSDCEFIILSHNKNPITNLPIGLKELRVSKIVDLNEIKIPFGCDIIYI